jgi:signal transduction histidine kinase
MIRATRRLSAAPGRVFRRLDQPRLVRVDDRLHPVAQAELSQYACDVRLHGRFCRARVHVMYEPDSVQLEVTDDGAGAAATNGAGGGQGLIGMRERVTLYGGVFEARPRAEGGFLVRARLPLGRESL